jgi:hypothetical protein
MVHRGGEVCHERLQGAPLLARAEVFEAVGYPYIVFKVPGAMSETG